MYNKPHIQSNTIIKYTPKYKQYEQAEFGKLEMLITPELMELCRPAKYIVIYGYTKSGKVKIGTLLAERLRRRLIISDHYKHLGWENNMYHIRSIIESTNEPLIIEGVQSGRLLRKGVQRNDFFANVVIHLDCNRQSIAHCYVQDGEGEKLKYVHNFNANILDKIFYEWYDLQKQKHPKKMPVLINMNTSFL